MDDTIKKTLEKFPFLSLGRYLDTDYIGIIGNSDQQFISMYVYNNLPDDPELKRRFLILGEGWWWESQRQISINLYIRDWSTLFRSSLKHFIRKDFELIAGPCVSLQDFMHKRIKRRTITLVKNI